MRSAILALAVGCAVSAAALPISKSDPLADINITGPLVPVNTTANTTESQVPSSLTSPLPDVGEDPLSGAAFLASPRASSDPLTSDPPTSDDPPVSNSSTGIPPTSSSSASSSTASTSSAINSSVVSRPESSHLPFKPHPHSEAAAFSLSGFKRKLRSRASWIRARQERRLAETGPLAPVNTTDPTPANSTSTPNEVGEDPLSGAAFLSSPPASHDLAASEPPTSNDPPAGDPPASDPLTSSGHPPSSGDAAALSITAFKRIFRAAASSRHA